jgi:hypothetical protein
MWLSFGTFHSTPIVFAMKLFNILILACLGVLIHGQKNIRRQLPEDGAGNQVPADQSGWTCEPLNVWDINSSIDYCTINEDVLDGNFKAHCCAKKNPNKHDVIYRDEANYGYDCCKCSKDGGVRYGPVNEDGTLAFDERCGGIAFGESP